MSEQTMTTPRGFHGKPEPAQATMSDPIATLGWIMHDGTPATLPGHMESFLRLPDDDGDWKEPKDCGDCVGERVLILRNIKFEPYHFDYFCVAQHLFYDDSHFWFFREGNDASRVIPGDFWSRLEDGQDSGIAPIRRMGLTWETGDNLPGEDEDVLLFIDGEYNTAIFDHERGFWDTNEDIWKPRPDIRWARLPVADLARLRELARRRGFPERPEVPECIYFRFDE